MSKYILGIIGGLRVGYQGTSALLIRGGELISYVEEERITRDKRLRGRFSESAIHCIVDSIYLYIDNIKYVVTHGESWNIGCSNILTVMPEFKQ